MRTIEIKGRGAAAGNREQVAAYQRAVGEMVEREVVSCVSGWVAKAAEADEDFAVEANDGPIDWRDVASACSDPVVLERRDNVPGQANGLFYVIGANKPVSWADLEELPVLEDAADVGAFVVAAMADDADDAPTVLRYVAATADVHDSLEEAAREAADANGIDLDDYRREIYEHWEVSRWLADRLEEAGERVIEGFGQFRVWCRTTTGQGIAGDEVVGDIFDATERERATWTHYDPPVFVQVVSGPAVAP
jgi:hypothetical protein